MKGLVLKQKEVAKCCYRRQSVRNHVSSRCMTCDLKSASYYKKSIRSMPKYVLIRVCISLYIASCFDQSFAFSLLPNSLLSNDYRYRETVTNNVDHMNIDHYFANSLCQESTFPIISRAYSTQLSVRKQKPMPIIGYNGEDICDYYDRRPLVVGWRLNILSLPLLGELIVCIFKKLTALFVVWVDSFIIVLVYFY